MKSLSSNLNPSIQNVTSRFVIIQSGEELEKIKQIIRYDIEYVFIQGVKRKHHFSYLSTQNWNIQCHVQCTQTYGQYIAELSHMKFAKPIAKWTTSLLFGMSRMHGYFPIKWFSHIYVKQHLSEMISLLKCLLISYLVYRSYLSVLQ